MTRLLILLFVLNTLLPSAGVAAMLSSNTSTMSQSNHSTMMASHHCSMSMTADNDQCNDNSFSNELCKLKCATACSASAIHISVFAFEIPFLAYNTEINTVSPPFYTRSISPELRPPLA